jgi:hypothetical protein
MQIGEQVLKLLLVQFIVKGGHHGASVLDDVRDAFVIGRCAAGQKFLRIQVLESGAFQAVLAVGIVAAGAGALEDLIAVCFLRCELGDGLGRRQGWAASGDSRENESQKGESRKRGMRWKSQRQGMSR